MDSIGGGSSVRKIKDDPLGFVLGQLSAWGITYQDGTWTQQIWRKVKGSDLGKSLGILKFGEMNCGVAVTQCSEGVTHTGRLWLHVQRPLWTLWACTWPWPGAGWRWEWITAWGPYCGCCLCLFLSHSFCPFLMKERKKNELWTFLNS